MISSMPSGHTEDGIMVNLEITRNENGKTQLTGVEIIPTWVYKKGQDNPTYYVIPVNKADEVESMTGIGGITGSCRASSARTHEIIDSGMKKVKKEFGF